MPTPIIVLLVLLLIATAVGIPIALGSWYLRQQRRILALGGVQTLKEAPQILPEHGDRSVYRTDARLIKLHRTAALVALSGAALMVTTSIVTHEMGIELFLALVFLLAGLSLIDLISEVQFDWSGHLTLISAWRTRSVPFELLEELSGVKAIEGPLILMAHGRRFHIHRPIERFPELIQAFRTANAKMTIGGY